VIGFAVASVVGGASVDGAHAHHGPGRPGAFGAVLVSSTKSLLVNTYTDGDQRARVIGVFTATLTGGLALGLVLGGVLTSELNWRWCLYVNVPLALVVIVGTPRLLPATAWPSGDQDRRDQRRARDGGHGGPDLRAWRGRLPQLGLGPGRRLPDRRRRAPWRLRGPPGRQAEPAAAAARGDRPQPRLGHDSR